MSLRSLLAHQLGRPSGFAGMFMGRTLDKVNACANRVALEQLSLCRTDHLLEVGFGGGLLLRQALPRMPAGFAAGIEVSHPMLRRARRTFRGAIRAGSLEINEAGVSSIPYPEDRFDKACAVNTLHFWPDPSAGFQELMRVLKPGGLLVVVVRPKDFLEKIAFTKHGFAAFDDRELRNLMERAGFRDVRIEPREDADMGMVLAISEKPTAPADFVNPEATALGPGCCCDAG